MINRVNINVGYINSFNNNSNKTLANDNLNQAILQTKKITGTSFETVGRGASISTLKRNNELLSIFKKKVKYGQPIFSMDLETIGAFGEGVSEPLSNILTITEASLLKLTPYTKDGHVEYKPNIVSSFALGVDAKQAQELRTMASLWESQSFHNYTKNEISSINSAMDRLARIGASVADNGGKIPMIDGVPRMPAIEKAYDRTNLTNINLGIHALQDLGDRGYTINGTKGNALFKDYMNAMNKLTNDKNEIVLGHNQTVFDYAMLEEVSKRGKIKYDIGDNSIDVLKLIKDYQLNSLNFYGSNKNGLAKGYSKQENITTAFSYEPKALKGMAHTSDFDSSIVPYMLTTPLANGETMIESFEKAGNEMYSRLATITPGSKDVFRTTNTLFFSALNGDKVSDTNNLILDHVLSKDNTGKYTINERRRATFKNNSNYKFENFKTINKSSFKDFLTNEQIKSLPDDVENLYVGEFRQRGNGRDGDIIRVIRSNKNAFEDIFSNNLEKIDLTYTELKKESIRDTEEQARNTFSGIGSSEYYRHKKGLNILKAYDNASEEFLKNGERLTKAKIEATVNKGYYQFKNNKKLTAQELFPQFYTNKGQLNSELLDTELAAHQYVKSIAKTSSIISDVIDSIPLDGMANKEIFKAQLFKNTMSKADNLLEEAGMPVVRESSTKSTLQKASMVSVEVDGKTRYIDTRSENKIKSSIRSIIYQDNHNVKNENTRAGSNKSIVRNIMDQLKDKGVISSSTEEKVEKSFQDHFNVDLIAKDVFKSMKDNTNLLSDVIKQDPVLGKRKIEKRIEELKEEKKSLYEIKKTINSYGYNADGETNESKALENIEKDRKKATEEIVKLEKAKTEIEKNITDPYITNENFKNILNKIDELEKQKKEKSALLKKYGPLVNKNSNKLNDILKDKKGLGDKIGHYKDVLIEGFKKKAELENKVSSLAKKKDHIQKEIRRVNRRIGKTKNKDKEKSLKLNQHPLFEELDNVNLELRNTKKELKENKQINFKNIQESKKARLLNKNINNKAEPFRKEKQDALDIQAKLRDEIIGIDSEINNWKNGINDLKNINSINKDIKMNNSIILRNAKFKENLPGTNNKISEINEEIKLNFKRIGQVNWFTNVGSHDMETLNVTKPVKAGDLSYDKAIEKLGISQKEIKDLVYSALGDTPINYNGINRDTQKGISSSANAIHSKLVSDLGWSDSEAGKLINTLFSEEGNKIKGLETLKDKDKKLDLAYSIVSKYDEKTKSERNYLVFTRKKNLASMNALNNSEKEFGANMVYFELPKKITKNGVEYIKRGGSIKLNTSKLESYYNTYNNKFVINQRNVIERMIGTLKTNVVSNNIYDAIDNGEGQGYSKLINNISFKAMKEAPGHTGTTMVETTVNDAFGHAIKQVVEKLTPNAGDLSSMHTVDISELINFAPYLYQSDKTFKEMMDTSIEKLKNGKNALEYFNTWISEIKSGNGLRKLDDVEAPVKELFINNFKGGAEIYKMIRNNTDIMAMFTDDKSFDMDMFLKNVELNGSQNISEPKVSEFKMTFKPLNKIYGSGEYVSNNRPLTNQAARYQHINLDKFSEKEIKQFKEHGISLGRSINSIGSKELLQDDADNFLAEGLTINFKSIGNVENIKLQKNFVKNINENEQIKEVFYKKVSKTVKSLDVDMNREELLKIADKLLKSSWANDEITNTYMQRTVLSPLLTKMLQAETYHNFKKDRLETVSKSIGDTVKLGDIIGFDAEGNEITYSHQREGIIVGDSGDKFIIKETDKAVNNIKVNLGVTEKGIAHMQVFENEKELAVAQGIWEARFGKASAIGQYELKKHYATTYALSDVQTIADMTLRKGNEKYQKEFMEHLKGVTDNGNVELFTKYKGKKAEYSMYLYENSSDPNKNIFKAYQDIIDTYKEKAKDPNADSFYKEIVKQMEENNKEKDVNTVAFNVMQFNRIYGNQVDENVSIDELADKYGAKDNARDSYHFGRKIIRAPESEKYFVTTDANGNRKYIGENITNFLEKQYVGTKEYVKAAHNLNNIDMALGLRSGAIKESAFNGKLHTVDLSNIILPKTGVDADYLKDTIFAKSDANVIKINIGNSNILLEDVMNYTKNMNGDRFYKKVDSIYIPVQKNNFTKDGTFVPTKTQKNIADLIDSLQKTAQYDSDNTTGYKIKAQNFYNELVRSAEFEYTNKDGMLHQYIQSGRKNYSGTDLVTKIYSSERYLKGSKYIDENHAFNHTFQTMINGKEDTAYMDIVYTSEDSIKKKAGKNVFRDIGQQLVEENNFDDNNNFIEHLKSKNILNEEGKLLHADNDAFELIGKEYAKTEGLQGFTKRYPTFSGDSKIALKIRLDEGARGNTMSTFGYTIMKLKGDVDGDSVADMLFLDKDLNGRTRIFNKSNKLRKDHTSLITGEAIENGAYWVGQDIKEYKKIEGQQLNKDIDIIKDTMENGNAENGNFLNPKAIYAETKAKFDKAAIGPISNTNYYLNQIADYAERQGIIDSKQLNDVMKMTKITEQKPISSKFFINASNAAGATSRQGLAFRKIVNGNLDDGFDMLMTSLKDMGLLANEKSLVGDEVNFDWLKEKDYLNHEWLKAGDNNLTEESKEILKGTGALVQALSNSDVQIQWKKSGFIDHSNSRNNSNVRETVDVVNDIINNNIDANTFRTKNLEEKREDINRAVEHKSKIAQSINNNNIYYDSDGASYSVLNRMQTGKDSIKFTMKNLDSGDILSLNGKGSHFIEDTNNSIHSLLTDNLMLGHIDTTGLSDKEKEFLSSSDFANDYKFAVGKYQKSVLSDIDNAEHYSNELDALNQRIIELGREAGKNKKQQVKDEVTNTYKRIEKLNSVFTNRDLLEDDDLLEEMKSFRTQKGSVTSYSNTHKRSSNANQSTRDYSHLENLKANHVDSYINDFHGMIDQVLNDNENLNTSEYRKETVQRFYDESNALKIASKNALQNGDISRQHLEEYINDKNSYKDYAKWNTDWDEVLSNTKGVKSTINNLNELGQGKISSGNYAGFSYSELSKEQRAETLENLEALKSNSKENKNAFNMLRDNIESLKNYDRYVGYVDDLNNNSEVANVIKDINNSPLPKNYSSEMEKTLDGNLAEKQMKEINKAIIEEANKIKNGEYTERTITHETKEMIDNSFHMNQNKVLAIGAGIMATTALLGAASGVAGKLNPNATPSATHNENNQDFQSKKLSPISPVAPRNIYMQDAQKGYRIHAKSKYGEANDLEISRALSVAHSDKIGKVNIHVQNGYNTDDNWFNSAMSNELS